MDSFPSLEFRSSSQGPSLKAADGGGWDGSGVKRAATGLTELRTDCPQVV